MKKTKIAASVAMAVLIGATVGLSACGGNGKDDTNRLDIMTISTTVSDEELNGGLATVLNEQTEYDVTWRQLNSDSQSASAQFNSIFTDRNSQIDAVKLSKAQLYQYMNSGALKDLTEYVNKTTNLKDQISELGWSLASKDGKIYGIPQRAPTLTNNILMVYRADWLNLYNADHADAKIEVPSEDNGYAMTVSNFKKMCEYFTDTQNADGLVVQKGLGFQEAILPAFGIYGEFSEYSDGKLYYEVEHPNFPQYMKYMQELYNHTQGSKRALRYNTSGAAATDPLTSFNSNQCGVARVAFWNGANLGTKWNANQVGTIQALVDDKAADSNGHIDPANVRVIATDSYNYFTVVPTSRSNRTAEKVVDFADKLLEKNLFKRAIIGIENTHFQKGEDGLDWPILDRFGELDIADKYLLGTREEDYGTYWWTRARKNEVSYQLTLVAFNNIKNTGIKCPIEAMPPLEAYNDHQASAISEMTDTLHLAMFPGENAAEKYTLENVIAKYHEYHGDQVVTAVNEWYASWAGKATFNTVKAPVYN